MVTKRKTKSTGKKTTKRTTSKAKTKPKTKSKAKTGAKKKAFGGYAINFSGRKETVEQVFGKKPVAPSEMTKKLWAFVKAKQLATK